MKHRPRETHPLLLLGWQRQKVTSAGAHKTPWMPKHMNIHVPLPRSQPSYLPQEHLISRLVQLDACCKRISLTHPTGTPHSQVSMDDRMDPCLSADLMSPTH